MFPNSAKMRKVRCDSGVFNPVLPPLPHPRLPQFPSERRFGCAPLTTTTSIPQPAYIASRAVMSGSRPKSLKKHLRIHSSPSTSGYLSLWFLSAWCLRRTGYDLLLTAFVGQRYSMSSALSTVSVSSCYGYLKSFGVVLRHLHVCRMHRRQI